MRKPNLAERVEWYLGNGGLFNPEMMHPQTAVRDLIIDLLAEVKLLKATIKAVAECFMADRPVIPADELQALLKEQSK